MVKSTPKKVEDKGWPCFNKGSPFDTATFAHPLDTIDAMHVATAVFTNSHIFITRDGDGKKARRKLLPNDNKIPCRDGVKLRILTLTQYNNMKNASSHPLFVATPETPEVPKLKIAGD